MSSRTLAQHVPNREAVEQRIAGARFQMGTLKQLLGSNESSLAHLESCVSASIDQLLQAVTAALSGFNSMLPDPLPAQRVNRKNLRDQFYAVGAESDVLHALDSAAHSGDGWLWYLEQKHDGAAFGRLLVNRGSNDSPSFVIVTDPLNSNTATEDGDPIAYLNRVLDQVLEALDGVAEKASDDVITYRDAMRRQARRLI